MTVRSVAHRGFTLVELLVVVAIVALLLGLLLPALARGRGAALTAQSAANMRQIHAMCAMYANEHGGKGPALGVPWGSVPNWALVVQTYAGRTGETPGELYDEHSILVCPACQQQTAADMTRTYAMNVTGRAGLSAEDEESGGVADRDSFDEEPVFVRFFAVPTPSQIPLAVSSAPTPQQPDLPPPTRTYSVIDFRQQEHIDERLGWWHSGGERFQAVKYDGSVRTQARVDERWERALP